MSPSPSVSAVELEGHVFPPTVKAPGSAKTFFLGGAGERGLEIEGRFIKFTAIGVYLEDAALPSLAVKWKGKTAQELADSLHFYRDIVSGPFEKLTQVTMILPLTGKQYSEKVAENCVAHWKAIGTYTDSEAKAIEKFMEIFRDENFPPGASILFSQSPIGSLVIAFSKDGSMAETGNVVIENKQLSEAILESIIGKHGVSPAAKQSLASRISDLLKDTDNAAPTVLKLTPKHQYTLPQRQLRAMSPSPSVIAVELEGHVFPPTVKAPGSAKTFFLGGAGERGLEIEGRFIKFTAIGVYLEDAAILSLAVKWKGKTAEDLADSLHFYRDIVSGPFEKLTQVTMILPLTGKQYSEKVAENCVAHWKAIGTYTESEAKAIEEFMEVFKDENFPPGASILFTQSSIGSLVIAFSKDGSMPETGNVVIENKQLSEAILESIIGKHGVSRAAKQSLASRISDLLKETHNADPTG